MSAPLTPRGASEREAILRERAAFYNAVRWRESRTTTGDLQPSIAGESIMAESVKRYPLPKITRPRVVRDFNIDTTREFRVVDGVLQARDIGRVNEWGTEGLREWKIDAAVIRTFADLLANPTEEIDDDGSVSLLPAPSGCVYDKLDREWISSAEMKKRKDERRNGVAA